MSELKEFLKTATEEQRKCLYQIVDASEEEQKLIDKINAQAPTESGILFDGHSVELCEDEDDWKVITLGLRSELQQVRNKIKNLMIQAVKLGMGYLGFFQRNYEHYVGRKLTE